MTRTTPPEHPDGLAPDAWLREALRHAPDGDTAVPGAVRETILRQARAAVQPAMPAARFSRWRAWLDGWLRPARLGYSGAFMVLLVVGVWGLDRLDEQAREPLAPPQPETVVADAAPASVASAPAVVAARPASVAPATAVAAGPSKALPQAPAAAVGDRAPAAARKSANPAAAEVSAVPPAPPEPAPPPASPAPAAAPPIVAEGSARAQAEATPAAPAMAPKATPPVAGSARLAAPQDRAAVATLDPFASVLHRATEDAAVRWSVGPREGAVGTTQRAWLDALRAATAGRWVRESAAPIASAVQLSSGGGPMASLGVDAAGTLWLVLGPNVYRAPLSADARARFEEALSAW